MMNHFFYNNEWDQDHSIWASEVDICVDQTINHQDNQATIRDWPKWTAVSVFQNSHVIKTFKFKIAILDIALWAWLI